MQGFPLLPPPAAISCQFVLRPVRLAGRCSSEFWDCPLMGDDSCFLVPDPCQFIRRTLPRQAAPARVVCPLRTRLAVGPAPLDEPRSPSAARSPNSRIARHAAEVTLGEDRCFCAGATTSKGDGPLSQYGGFSPAPVRGRCAPRYERVVQDGWPAGQSRKPRRTACRDVDFQGGRTGMPRWGFAQAFKRRPAIAGKEGVLTPGVSPLQ